MRDPTSRCRRRQLRRARRPDSRHRTAPRRPGRCPDDRRPELRSRLLLGTGGFPSLELLAEAIAASGSELVTVALRRVDPPRARGSLIDVLADAGVQLLPNTAGCHTARDAVSPPGSRARRLRPTGSSSR